MTATAHEHRREMAEATGQALRSAGALGLYLVGDPGVRRAAYANSGIGSFIDIGCNVPETLSEALAHATGDGPGTGAKVTE